MPEKNIFSYILDQWYSLTRYDPAWVRPSVFRGYFEQHPEGYLQQLFFNELLAQGFRRTPWQLVFPGQTAGLICKVSLPQSDRLHQYHVRFYDDGTIDCELEPHNFSLHHLSGEKIVDATLLSQFLEHSTLDRATRLNIQKLFDTKEYNWQAIRVQNRPL